MKKNKVICMIALSIMANISIVGCEENNEKADKVEEITSEIVSEIATESQPAVLTMTTKEVVNIQVMETENNVEEKMTTFIEASVEYTYTDLSQTMYAKSSVNVRSGPDINSEIIGGLSTAEAVEVTGKCNETGWYRIYYRNTEGFVSGHYLLNEKPEIVEIPETVNTSETENSLEPATTESRKHALNVSCIMQNPELPTGCEVTSLAIVLNYIGIAADKCDLADNYIEKGEIGKTLPYDKFIGNPRDPKSFGCYSPVIVKCAEKYLSVVGESYSVTDLSGSTLENLFDEIDNGNPVIIWATINMDKPFYYSKIWHVDETDFRWMSREHCMVLTGYDLCQGIVYVADPMKGNVTYPIDVFIDRYEQMYSQAVVIK